MVDIHGIVLFDSLTIFDTRNTVKIIYYLKKYYKLAKELSDKNAELQSTISDQNKLTQQLKNEIDRYDKVCTEIRNVLTSAGIPELTEDRLTVVPLVERVKLALNGGK